MKHCGEKMDIFEKKQQSPRLAPFSRAALGMDQDEDTGFYSPRLDP
jgi:hypothetical protein